MRNALIACEITATDILPTGKRGVIAFVPMPVRKLQIEPCKRSKIVFGLNQI